MVFGRGKSRAFGAVFAVENTDEIVDAKHAAHFVVDYFHGHASGLYRLKQGGAESASVAAWHRNVQAGPGCFFSGARLKPVGHHESAESPTVFKYIREHFAAVAYEFVIHAVSRGHDGLNVGFLHGGFECREVDFVHGSVVDNRHVVVAVVFAIVAGVMFQACCNPLALNAFYLSCCNSAVQAGVFGVVFEEAAAERIAQNVAGRPEQDAPVDCAALLTHHRSGFFYGFRIPGGSHQYA